MNVVVLKRLKKKGGTDTHMSISKKDPGKCVGIYERATEERERETDICGYCKRKPLEAKVLNTTLRSDKSEWYLVPHCVEQDLSPALC